MYADWEIGRGMLIARPRVTGARARRREYAASGLVRQAVILGLVVVAIIVASLVLRLATPGPIPRGPIRVRAVLVLGREHGFPRGRWVLVKALGPADGAFLVVRGAEGTETGEAR